MAVGLLHLTASSAQPPSPQIDCTPQENLTIEVVPSQYPVRYDFSKKTVELNRIGQGAYSPYGEGHRNTELRGLTVGKQSLNHHVEFYYEKHKDAGLSCLQIQEVKVTMDYKPTVYVSTKFTEGTPIFKKILEHEKQHVQITQRVLHKYARILEERLKDDLKRGYSVGPFAIQDMEKKQRELQDRITAITAKVDRDMHEESQRQHNLFDDDELGDAINYNQGVARQLERILKLND